MNVTAEKDTQSKLFSIPLVIVAVHGMIVVIGRVGGKFDQFSFEFSQYGAPSLAIAIGVGLFALLILLIMGFRNGGGRLINFEFVPVMKATKNAMGIVASTTLCYLISVIFLKLIFTNDPDPHTVSILTAGVAGTWWLVNSELRKIDLRYGILMCSVLVGAYYYSLIMLSAFAF